MPRVSERQQLLVDIDKLIFYHVIVPLDSENEQDLDELIELRAMIGGVRRINEVSKVIKSSGLR